MTINQLIDNIIDEIDFNKPGGYKNKSVADVVEDTRLMKIQQLCYSSITAQISLKLSTDMFPQHMKMWIFSLLYITTFVIPPANIAQMMSKSIANVFYSTLAIFYI